MSAYSLSHLSDHDLLRDLASLVAQDRATTASLLAHLAEVDLRRLYLPAAYPSMFAYCVHELRLSDDAAYKRIQAARVARQFPVLFAALADGRLHLSAVGLLAPYLTPENAAELLAAAAHRTKSEIEELLAKRFPRSETMGLVQALPVSPRRTRNLPRGKLRHPGRSVSGQVAANLPRGKLARTPSWRRWPRNGFSSSSRSDGAPRRSCGTPSSCSAIGSPRATSLRCSTVRSRR